ncbi:MAG: Trk system potassium transporter TrkA [Eubacteriales bacterium]|nr:Trk system potassium transporter TrkA [Clostridiales bacterium]MDY5835631.1 Trk system potassium transporter TrkA [Eubacteriales bacterium]
MQIVIGGLGKVGTFLCHELSHEGHDVTVLDINENVLTKAIEREDIRTITGSITSIDLQVEATIPSCDVFIAATSSDEVNITAAMIASKLGAKHTVARVRDTEYGAHMAFMRESLGISYLINPEFEAARYLAEMLQFPAVYAMERFVNGNVTMMEAELASDSDLVGKDLVHFRQSYPSLLVTAVAREDEIFIPSGAFILESHDRIQVTGQMAELRQLYNQFTKAKKRYKKILIIGGGRIAHYLLQYLPKSSLEITLIEKNTKRASLLAGEFPHISVLVGDGTDHELLDETDLNSFDILLNLTGMDEENIMISLHAAATGVARTVTKVTRVAMLPLLASFDLQTILTPHRIAGEGLMRYIRARGHSNESDIEAVYHLMSNRLEAVEFTAPKEARSLNIPLKVLDLKPGVLVGLIYRKGQIIFPGGTDVLKARDRVIVISKEMTLKNLDDILA